ncbi:MAG: glycosyltransferase family 4 protein, partial [Spirochaetaceae bacterium]|nr:glycosyltransferase family 4 protein [Spirochaetaceae bacterium]
LHSKRLIPFLRFIAWKYIGLFVHRSDVMTAPSIHASNTLREHFPETRVEHIRNGIDLKEFENFADFETLTYNYPQFNSKTFLFVGRLGEEKSVSVLIEAFQKAHSQDPELRLFIVGDGPSRSAYEQTVQAQQLQDAVFFLGRLPHEELLHSGLYHHSRALVTASITENQPITVIEAIACHTPIIIPDVEGINELLFENGRSFPANDTEAFANEMLQIAHDDALYQHCTREGGKLRIEFDGMNIAEQFEELYTNVLE